MKKKFGNVRRYALRLNWIACFNKIDCVQWNWNAHFCHQSSHTYTIILLMNAWHLVCVFHRKCEVIDGSAALVLFDCHTFRHDFLYASKKCNQYHGTMFHSNIGTLTIKIIARNERKRERERERENDQIFLSIF